MTQTGKFNWVKWLSAVLVVPFLVFGPVGSWLATQAANSSKGGAEGLATWPVAIASMVIPIILMALAVFYWSDGVLARDWKRWRQSWGKNVLWALAAGVFMMAVILPVTKALTGFLDGAAFKLNFDGTSALSFGDVLPTMLASIIGLLAPFYEEIIFHHAITEPFLNRPRWAYVVVSFFSNVLFGVVHINNVNGHWSSLIMYIVMGFWFQFIFIRAGRNIWQNIMTHLVYNGSITLLTIFSMVIALLFGR
jgi:membrane protease YdiL (CAAX protease family)